MALAAALLLAGALGVALVSGSSAGLVPGGGKSETDCWIALDVEGVDVPPGTKRIECSDCDPACDKDGDTTPNNGCVFQVKACTNISGVAGCTATALRKAQVRPASLGIKPATDFMQASSACGALVEVAVPTKARGTKPGKRVLNLLAQREERPRSKDQEKLTLVCNPQPGTCPTLPTTSTAATTSSTSSTGPSTTSTSSTTTTSTSQPTTTSTSTSSTTSTSEETTTSTSTSSTTSTSEETTTSTSTSSTTSTSEETTTSTSTSSTTSTSEETTTSTSTSTTTLPMSPGGAFLA